LSGQTTSDAALGRSDARTLGRFRVLPATARDLNAVCALEARCFGPADRFPRRTWRRLLTVAARHGSSLTLVAADAAGIGGVVNLLLRRNAAVARIYSIAVDPAWRGRGVGRALLLAAAAAAPRRCRTLSLEVRADNAPAIGLYRACGFTESTSLPGYYPDGAAGVRLTAARVAVTPRTERRRPRRR
jgi:ribosomal-protein-alanine N-acetyltransferase